MTREPVRIIGIVIAVLTAIHQSIIVGEPVSAAVLGALIVAGTELQRSRVYSSESVRAISVDSYLTGAYDTAVAKRDGGGPAEP